MSHSPLFQSYQLPNGIRLKNRLCKAAMEESISEAGALPGQKMNRLYSRWAQGGSGLVITGNVMVSPTGMTGPGNVVLDSHSDLEPFKAWAKAGTANDTQLWMQINHPGRQMFAALGEELVSASDVPVNLPGLSKMFGQPRPLAEQEIADLVERYATTAQRAEEAGFTGVQIHAAHGYLISQFLSPIVNRRTDQWGGDLSNRARFLLDIVRRVREQVSAQFCVSVKLNSADFQRGGFSLDDAKQVVGWLNPLGVDLVELSGGNYESPAMQGRIKRQEAESSTGQREAYFVDFAREVGEVAEMPLMVTGGFYRRVTAESAISSAEPSNGNQTGIAVIGIARALALVPDLPNQWQHDQQLEVSLPSVNWKNKSLAGLAVQSLSKSQIRRLANGQQPNPKLSPVIAAVSDRLRTKSLTKRYRRWRAQSS